MRRRAVRQLEDLAERLRVMLRPARTAPARGAGSPSAAGLAAAFAGQAVTRMHRAVIVQHLHQYQGIHRMAPR